MSDTPRTDAAWDAMQESNCLPECSKYGHAELCPYANGENVMYEFARQLEREVDALREALAKLLAEKPGDRGIAEATALLKKGSP